MALTFLFGKNEPSLTLAQIDESGATISETTPDIMTNESHKWSANLTENPVEDGSPVSDHKYIVPKEYSVTVEYSNYPISISEAGTKDDRVTTAVEFFEGLLESQITVDISSKIKTYFGYVCTDVQLSRNTGAGDKQPITATFREFRTVSTEAIAGTVVSEEVSVGSTKLTKTGKQVPTEQTPSAAAQEASPSGSALSRLTGLGL